MSAMPQEKQTVMIERTTTIPSNPKKRFVLNERVQSFLLLLPSFIVIAIFVYFFISSTFYVSFSNWRTLKRDMTLREPVYQTYVEMFSMPRFQADIRNTIVFTVIFMSFAILLGLTLAILLDREIFASPVFRNMFLFPYALSFVVTGVAWRWIFNPETGINLFFDIFGVNSLLTQLGMQPLKPGWATDPNVVLQLNSVLAAIWPGAQNLQVKWGVPLALIPVAIAATWQLSGFVMAMYLGGMATISNDIREAARIDGASEWQIYRRVIIPILKPVTISVAVILLHVSLKIFDLVFTMSGVGPGFATDVPAIFVFEMMFKATRYNLGAAASIVMLVFVALVIIPYLASTLRGEDK
ncbi:MAG: Lactose transport system permease protein LacF [Anaerolineae bacterium]|nr:Lactose transport system permease protein LacF [Anaerolineae bacterium]